MQRRDFIVLGGAALAWSDILPAQDRVRTIGMLMQYRESPEVKTWVAALEEGLRAHGWYEGRNIRSEIRWSDADTKITQQLAKELVALKPELIFSAGSPTTAALMQETRTIPIIFGNLVDPIGQGFVDSLSKPGRNITGFVNLEASITGKHLELLKEVAPRLRKVVIFYNPATAPYYQIYVEPFRAAAAIHGVEPVVAAYRDLAELDTIMAAIAKEPNVGQIAMPSGSASANHREIAAMANRYRLPTIFVTRAAPAAGALISYGNDIPDNYRRAANYVDRILKGEKPSDLPVQFPVKFNLAVNLKTAKSLGLEVPQFMQQRADEVIE